MPCLCRRGNAFTNLPCVERIFRGFGNGEYAVKGCDATKPAGKVTTVSRLEEFRMFFGNDVVKYDAQITALSTERFKVTCIEFQRIRVDHCLHQPIPGFNGDLGVHSFCGGR